MAQLPCTTRQSVLNVLLPNDCPARNLPGHRFRSPIQPLRRMRVELCGYKKATSFFRSL